ncbi:uncharacterized protein V1518DRAFT_413833 [Limtongia smithiae]|uniref:uncharacterized protein n=1 Tax=Limtongia smithiae TaxID=1125753 RepID=UPI0034CFD987
MHNVKRVHTTAEAQALKKKREAVKIAEYQALVKKVLEARGRGDASQDALQLTTSLLKQNPEYYTIWNYRREILIAMFATMDKDGIQGLIDSDMTFLFARLREFPKCYWIWSHRQWCLETCPTPNWKAELALVNKLLEYDSRNFHGWHYRRYVVQSTERATDKSMVRQEFDFTTTKIKENFSNFSAWHNRTKLIPRLLQEESSIDRKEFLNKEIALITQAIYTDPDDQSVWLYHRWLLTANDIAILSSEERIALMQTEIKSISELLEVEPDSKWCLHSLAFYKEFVAKLQNVKPGPSVIEYLHKLEEIDPMRVKRYEDWESQIQT